MGDLFNLQPATALVSTPLFLSRRVLWLNKCGLLSFVHRRGLALPRFLAEPESTPSNLPTRDIEKYPRVALRSKRAV